MIAESINDLFQVWFEDCNPDFYFSPPAWLELNLNIIKAGREPAIFIERRGPQLVRDFLPVYRKSDLMEIADKADKYVDMEE